MNKNVNTCYKFKIFQLWRDIQLTLGHEASQSIFFHKLFLNATKDELTVSSCGQPKLYDSTFTECQEKKERA